MSRHPRLSPRTQMEGGHEFGAQVLHLPILATYPPPAKFPTQPKVPLPAILLQRTSTQEMLETRTPYHEDPRTRHLRLHSNSRPPLRLRGPSLHDQQAAKVVDFSGRHHSKRLRGAPRSGTVGQTLGPALLLLLEPLLLLCEHHLLPKETHQQLVLDQLSRSPLQSPSRASSRTMQQLQLRKLSSRRWPSTCRSRRFHNSNSSSNRVGVRS